MLQVPAAVAQLLATPFPPPPPGGAGPHPAGVVRLRRGGTKSQPGADGREPGCRMLLLVVCQAGNWKACRQAC
jgi:hypothetical protein